MQKLVKYSDIEKKFFLATLLVIFILSVAGIVYLHASNYLNRFLDKPIILPVPLTEFPVDYNGWTGKDIPISETILKVAKNDDYLNRQYHNKTTQEWANIYVAYTARPRVMLGHRPEVCYPSSGFVTIDTHKDLFISDKGTEIPCLIHHFQKPGTTSLDIIVLNFYIVNGRLTNEEDTFSSVGWRTPNIEGNIARYVTQVQISSLYKNHAITMAKTFSDQIIKYFPDENGIVGIVDN